MADFGYVSEINKQQLKRKLRSLERKAQLRKALIIAKQEELALITEELETVIAEMDRRRHVEGTNGIR
jgi:hypothetical protein